MQNRPTDAPSTAVVRVQTMLRQCARLGGLGFGRWMGTNISRSIVGRNRGTKVTDPIARGPALTDRMASNDLVERPQSLHPWFSSLDLCGYIIWTLAGSSILLAELFVSLIVFYCIDLIFPAFLRPGTLRRQHPLKTLQERVYTGPSQPTPPTPP